MRHFTILVLEGSAGSAEAVAQLFCRTLPGATVSQLAREKLTAYLATPQREGTTCDLIVDLEVLGDNYRGSACEAIRRQMPDAMVAHLCGSPGQDHRSAAFHLCTRHQGPGAFPAILVVHCTAGWERQMLRQVKMALILRTARKHLQRLMPDEPS